MVNKITLRTCKGKQAFLLKKDWKFIAAIDLYKCLKQIKISILLYTCVPIS